MQAGYWPSHWPTSFAGSINTLSFWNQIGKEEGRSLILMIGDRFVYVRSMDAKNLPLFVEGVGEGGPVRGVSRHSFVWIQKHLIITWGWNTEPGPRQTLTPGHSSWEAGTIGLSLSCWLWLSPWLTSDGLTGDVEPVGACDGEMGRAVFHLCGLGEPVWAFTHGFPFGFIPHVSELCFQSSVTQNKNTTSSRNPSQEWGLGEQKKPFSWLNSEGSERWLVVFTSVFNSCVALRFHFILISLDYKFIRFKFYFELKNWVLEVLYF